MHWSSEKSSLRCDIINPWWWSLQLSYVNI